MARTSKARITTVAAMVCLTTLLAVLLPRAAALPAMPTQAAEEATDEAATATPGVDAAEPETATDADELAAGPEHAADARMQADEVSSEDADEALMQADAPDDDDDMRGRMAYLILSLWDSGELQGLDDLDDGNVYLPVDGDAGMVRDRRKRDLVFRPLWVTKMLHARRKRLRQRYFNEYIRPQRVTRDVETAAEAAEAESLPLLSRQRRQWTFKPLFALREKSARGQRQKARGRRVRRAGPAESADESGVVAEAAEPLSRKRREWVDVPLFAVKQIHAERIKDEEEITDPHRRRQQLQRYRDYETRDYRGGSRDFRDYRDFRESRPYVDYRFRPYRDYYRYYG